MGLHVKGCVVVFSYLYPKETIHYSIKPRNIAIPSSSSLVSQRRRQATVFQRSVQVERDETKANDKPKSPRLFRSLVSKCIKGVAGCQVKHKT